MENITTVFYLGPNGSYTQIAKEKFAKHFKFEKIHSIGMKNIKSVLDNFTLNENTIAIVPVENSIEGFVRETLDGIKSFKDPDLTIFASTQIPIKHCLVGNTNNIGNIKTVVSHPQALAQCQNTIISLIPNEIEMLPFSSTSGSAIYIKDKDESFAAITNFETAKLYGLNVLKENINDEKGNITRFLMLKRGTTLKTEHDKTSIVFSTKNEHGALFKVLRVFEKNKINLTNISSRPNKKVLGEYIFFVDFTGHITEKNIIKTLKDVNKQSTWMKILGSFEEI
ncbi:prephenate dehydratase [bacterium]|nr:prephenate dehydratase [bacterium]